ncbi:uncharacterized protein AB675_7950 [Cyphellophora attinorum]|uniref:Uncharacterized protein n=1 Tax=Cyphellophora attinorum TaxID=1664694 RepID=A0A0N0NN54_9EURO|nr:uncharacterized protein AB675_7950 [Phialophora attinorum]KPI41221.1 hypothetical protein AB675_7950 [Phialophora attinorum]
MSSKRKAHKGSSSSKKRSRRSQSRAPLDGDEKVSEFEPDSESDQDTDRWPSSKVFEFSAELAELEPFPRPTTWDPSFTTWGRPRLRQTSARTNPSVQSTPSPTAPVPVQLPQQAGESETGLDGPSSPTDSPRRPPPGYQYPAPRYPLPAPGSYHPPFETTTRGVPQPAQVDGAQPRTPHRQFHSQRQSHHQQRGQGPVPSRDQNDGAVNGHQTIQDLLARDALRRESLRPARLGLAPNALYDLYGNSPLQAPMASAQEGRDCIAGNHPHDDMVIDFAVTVKFVNDAGEEVRRNSWLECNSVQKLFAQADVGDDIRVVKGSDEDFQLLCEAIFLGHKVRTDGAREPLEVQVKSL